eukprot:190967_1
MAQASKNRKRSLSEAFRHYPIIDRAPPSKRQRLQSMNERPSICEHRNDTTFLIGSNKTVFDVNAQLFCNQSELFRDLIESNRTNEHCTVHITDVNTATFQFIVDFIYLRHPLLSFKSVIQILRFALKYQLLSLIQHCRHKLTNIDGNMDDWYHIMFSFEQQTHATQASLQPFVTHFIQNNPFADIDSLTLNSRFARLTIASITHLIAHYTGFDGEASKLLVIHRYLKSSATHKSTIYESIHKHFIQFLDLNALTHWATNSANNDYDLLIDVIDSLKKGNQANPRKHHVHDKSVPSTPKPHHKVISISSVENDNDEKQRSILSKYGFKECDKIHSTGHGGVWR